jgi:hypothetical protein
LGKAKVFVAIAQDEATKQELTIANEDGQVVYSSQPRKTGTNLVKIFNLSNLENGNYTFKFKNGTSTVKREVLIENGNVSVQPLVTEYAPVFAFDKNILKVSYMNYLNKNVVLYVYDDEDLIFKSSLGKDFSMQRGFDFSKLERGEYNVVLASADEKYAYSFTK